MSRDRGLWVRRAGTVLVVGVFAALGAATSSSEGDGSSSGEGSGGGNPGISALERNFRGGQPYGDGPGAQQIAAAVHDEIEQGDSVAVKVIPGTPQKIVVLVKFGDSDVEGLADLSDSDRRDQLEVMLMAVDGVVDAQSSEVGVAIRGTLLYGAMAVRKPGQPVDYRTGFSVDVAPLEQMLNPPAPAPAATPAAAPAAEAPAAPAAAPEEPAAKKP